MHFNSTVSSLRRRSCSFVADRLRGLNQSAAMQHRIEATTHRFTEIIQAALVSSDTLTNELQRQLDMQQTTRRSSVANVMTTPVLYANNRQPEEPIVIDIQEMDNADISPLEPPPPPPSNRNVPEQPPQQQQQAQNSALSQLHSLYLPIQGVFPFAAICIAKLVFDHRMGLLMLIGLYGTFHHANTALMRNIVDARTVTRGSQCSQRGGVIKKLCGLFRREAFLLSNVWIILFLALNIFLVYFMFSDEKLHNSLMFTLPDVADNYHHISLWTMIWVVGVTDFIIRFGTIIVKTFVTMTPEFIIETKHKGRYYMLVERLSHTYRSLTPIVPWLSYLYDIGTDSNMYFSIITVIAYVIFKALSIYNLMKEVSKIITSFRNNNGYGIKPTENELNVIEHCCPICQDKISEPVKLSCNHIFCDTCISHWFDREKTCPMCRKSIVEQPQYRDGSTYNIPIMC